MLLFPSAAAAAAAPAAAAEILEPSGTHDLDSLKLDPPV